MHTASYPPKIGIFISTAVRIILRQGRPETCGHPVQANNLKPLAG